MKNYVRNLYCGCGVLAFSVVLGTETVMSATTGCIPGNCDGYTKTAAECSGKTAIKCPFDTNKIYCEGESIVCNAGSGLVDGICKTCEGNTVSAKGDNECKICPTGQTANSSHTKCEAVMTCEQAIRAKGGTILTNTGRDGTTNNLYLIGNVIISGNMNLSRDNIYSAHEKLPECSSATPNPKLTLEGYTTLYDYVNIHVPVLITDLNLDENGNQLNFYNDAELHYVKISGPRAYFSFSKDNMSENPVNIEIHAIDMNASYYYDFDMYFNYEADNIKVDISDLSCETWNDCSRKCILNMDGSYNTGSLNISNAFINTNGDSCSSLEAVEIAVGNRREVCTIEEISEGYCSISSANVTIGGY